MVSDILDELGEETAALIREKGRKAAYIHCDTASAKQVATMVKATADNFGGLDCLVNNAGIEGNIASIIDGDEAAFDQLTGINLRGVWL